MKQEKQYLENEVKQLKQKLNNAPKGLDQAEVEKFMSNYLSKIDDLEEENSKLKYDLGNLRHELELSRQIQNKSRFS